MLVNWCWRIPLLLKEDKRYKSPWEASRVCQAEATGLPGKMSCRYLDKLWLAILSSVSRSLVETPSLLPAYHAGTSQQQLQMPSSPSLACGACAGRLTLQPPMMPCIHSISAAPIPVFPWNIMSLKSSLPRQVWKMVAGRQAWQQDPILRTPSLKFSSGQQS